MVTLCLTFGGTAPSCSRATMYEGSNFSTSSPTLATVHLCDYAHSCECEAVPRCGFNLYFLKDKVSFHVIIDPLYICFGDMSIQIFSFLIGLTFNYWVVTVLFISWICVFFQTYDLQIFSHIPRVVFSFSWECPLKYKFGWNLIYCAAVTACDLVSYIKLPPNPRSQRLVPVFF